MAAASNIETPPTEPIVVLDDPRSVLAKPSWLTPTDLAAFSRLGIPLDLLLLAGIQRVADQEAREKYGIRGPATSDMSGIVFPYLQVATGARVTARLRRDNPEIEEGKEKNKYISAYGDRKHLYFPPGAADKLQSPDAPIVLVEAEKSALALTAWAERTAQNLLAVAMGGCWGWRGRIGKRENQRGERVDEMGPISDLSCCDGRKVYVLLDANVATNPKVQQAHAGLIRELKRRGSEILVCNLPTLDGVNGPDDYIAVCGDEAMTEVFTAAQAAIAAYDYGGGRFEVSDRGVVFKGPPDKEGNPKPPVWICAPLHVLAKTRDSKSVEWGLLLEWRDADRVAHLWAMPIELLQRDGGAEARCELARQGLAIAPGRAARELFPAYLQVWPTDGRARCVARLGWHNEVYVLPTEAVGHASETIVFQNPHGVEPALSVSGTSDEWRESVAALAQGNSRLVFALSIAFAGPLLELAGEDSGGFHLRGPSSTGKSTALKLAASVWGNPLAYCRLWRATANGLEGLAALHNDGLLILDELSQIDPTQAGEAAYLLANGQGKNRASRNGTARQAARWRLLFLSAGEESLSALMAHAKRKPTAGQEIRMAEVDADANTGTGTLEVLHGYDSPAALALALKDVATRHYGAVGAELLRRIVNDRPKLAAVLSEGVRQFVEEFAPANAGGQIERVARRFGLIAVAGEIATRYGLTGWPEHDCERAAAKCFASWLESFGWTGNREERELLAQVRSFLEQHGASRFEDMNGDDGQRVINRAGFYRNNVEGAHGEETREYLVLPEAFRREVCAGFDAKFAKKVLQSHGWLVPSTDRISQKIRLPGMGSTWVYVLTAKMWEAE
jgi:uncharacterized protein (DUF927 family)